MRPVEFQTRDNVKIVADYYPPAVSSSRGVILVHMMPATRKSWNEFAVRLMQAGYHVLAIDLRGHGDSGGGDYRQFSQEQHQASIADLVAAAEFLKAQRVSEIAVVGASIGANLALQHLAQDPQIRAAVLLSPGFDYHGIQTLPLAAQVPDKDKILLVGADDDAAGMGASCEDLQKRLNLSQKICFAAGGHGTNLLQSHPELAAQILDYLNKQF